MEITNLTKQYQICVLSWVLVGCLSVLVPNVVSAGTEVGLYDLWETQVSNSKSYSNPFDYNVIELQATFTSPNGSKANFFGFYDGNGKGGQNGNVWKLRFMPDKIGTWTYRYTWTDGTSGGSGSFKVVDTGLPGPLKVANDNPWYFMDSRNKPFHFRGYDLHGLNYDNATVSMPVGENILDEEGRIKNLIDRSLIEPGYNFTMVMLDVDRKKRRPDAWGNRSFWLNTSDTKRFDLPVWHVWERLISRMADRNVYVVTFAAMIAQKSQYSFNDFKVFLRYFVARFASYYNFFGWSPVWEWTDIWSPSEVNQVMQQVQAWDPSSRLLSIHDCSKSTFSGWLDFSMRQGGNPSRPVRNIFDLNSRRVGQSQGSCGETGGVGSSFANWPIVGSEDIWEGTLSGQPRTEEEVRRVAWGSMLAGVMPLYSEWHGWTKSPGKMPGEAHIRRMFDFFYSKTRYRQYKQLNHLVSKSDRQIASGKEGHEYLVYDENGGAITINLSGAGSSNTFDVLWYNPRTGATQTGRKVVGGSSHTLQSPISGDTVLFLARGEADRTPPSAPVGLIIK